MPNVLVIGGAGLVGIPLVRQLLKAGFEASVIDNQSALARSDPRARSVIERAVALLAKEVEIVEVDIAVESPVIGDQFKNGVDCVIYLPALRARDCDRYQDLAVDAQITGLVNALRYAARAQVSHFVLASTSYVYGDFDTATEASPLRPVDTYGRLKVAAEQIVTSFGEAGRLSYTIVRPINVYGPLDARPRFAGAAILAALGAEDFVIRAPDERFDFTYAEDTARAFVEVARNPAARNRTFNFGSGRPITAKDFASRVQTVFPAFRVRTQPSEQRLKGETTSPVRGIFDSSRARSELGVWTMYSHEDGIRHFAETFRSLEGGGGFADA